MAAVSPPSLSPATTPPPDKQPRRWPLEVLWLLAILAGGNLVGLALVFLWVWRSRTPLACLGFVRPNNLARTVAMGTLGGVALKLALKALIMPALGFDAINPVYRYVTGNPSALWRMLLLVIIGGGIGEETIFRGFLFHRLRVLGGGRWGQLPVVIVTSSAFAVMHYADQGVSGAVQASMTGLTLGTVYLLSGNIWAPMVVHGAYDVAALLLIYWNLESAVAHALLH